MLEELLLRPILDQVSNIGPGGFVVTWTVYRENNGPTPYILEMHSTDPADAADSFPLTAIEFAEWLEGHVTGYV